MPIAVPYKLILPRQYQSSQRVAFANNQAHITLARLDMTEVKFEDVRQGLADGSLVYLDVRNRDELEKDGKVKGSRNVPLPEIEEAFTSSDADFETKYGFPKLTKDAAVVCACLAGRRAAAAVDKLKGLGYTGLRWYSGSFQDWKAHGGDLE